MIEFDWQKSKLGENAQSCTKVHDGKTYRLAVSPTFASGEFQAMCNGVRLRKTFFRLPSEAKEECERWFMREVLNMPWDAETALMEVLKDKKLVERILEKFKVSPR